MDLSDSLIDTGDNAPPLGVSELAGSIKRTIEGAFGRVRVRGEIGRVVTARSGHVYFDLKDDRAVLPAVAWKGVAAGLALRPEEGLEVIATGRVTTFAQQGRYQLVVEALVPAGAGALMAMLEKRKADLAAEGLFDAARKKPLPYLPARIGVVTSPTGAVIRDILHRLADRFPRPVLLWPVTVQGQSSAQEVAAAIRGFNALAPGGRVPRPDVIIVARGGGSVEDLWGFNEEIVVRAAAESAIPLISAVGHETDTTLIDFAADRRAPTPTAAAEMAVPVRAELLARIADLGARQQRALRRQLDETARRQADLARRLPTPQALVAERAQTLDAAIPKLDRALAAYAANRRIAFVSGPAGRFGPRLLDQGQRLARDRLATLWQRQQGAGARILERGRAEVVRLTGRHRPGALTIALGAGKTRFGSAARAFSATATRQLERWQSQLSALERARRSVGYEATLARGFAVVEADGAVVTRRDEAARAASLSITFQDGRLAVQRSEPPAAKRRPGPKPTPDDQGQLF